MIRVVSMVFLTVNVSMENSGLRAGQLMLLHQPEPGTQEALFLVAYPSSAFSWEKLVGSQVVFVSS